jgi:predicted metal-dependent phosphoesterase TrpH
MRGDLHIHTTASDGLIGPKQLAREAIAGGLDFVSVTDHNTMDALPLVEAALAGSQVRLIYGVELSSQPERGEELHILGYGVDPGSPSLQAICRAAGERKRQQIREIVRRLEADGLPISADDIANHPDDCYLGRPILASLLKQRGVVGSVGQAFALYLGSDAPAFVPMQRLTPQLCIEAIHAAGGVAVLAHPTMATIDAWIARLTGMGLDGVEVHRPASSGNEQLYVEKAAEHFGLFVTGGSDLHGREWESRVGEFGVDACLLSGFFEAVDDVRKCR